MACRSTSAGTRVGAAGKTQRSPAFRQRCMEVEMRRIRIPGRGGRLFALALASAPLLPLHDPLAALSLSPPPDGYYQVEIEGSASALQLGNAFAAVAKAVQPAVVFIRVESLSTGGPPPANVPHGLREALLGTVPRASTSSGTGFIILPNGFIVTNQHLIESARRVFVRLFDGREYEAEIVGEDVLSDIAVLKIQETDLPTAFLGDSDHLRVGEWVLAIGNPMGSTLMFSVTAGIVSATERSMGMPNSTRSVQEYIQTDAVANMGNSGGPLVDLYGDIVGMNSAIASRSGYYQGYTLAIPANLILPVVSQLMDRGHVTRGVLGAATSQATAEDALAVGLESVCGVVVQDIGAEDSPVRRAGLRPGDVIVDVDGYRVMSVAQLQRSVWFRAPGDAVVLTVHREAGVLENVTVYLGAEPIEDRASERAEQNRRERDLPCADHPLGICLIEFDEARGLASDIPREHAGPVVIGVYPAGPSYGKIFANHEIITHVNDVRVHSEEDLADVLRRTDRGDIVSVQTYRLHADETGFARIRMR